MDAREIARVMRPAPWIVVVLLAAAGLLIFLLSGGPGEDGASSSSAAEEEHEVAAGTYTPEGGEVERADAVADGEQVQDVGAQDVEEASAVDVAERPHGLLRFLVVDADSGLPLAGVTRLAAERRALRARVGADSTRAAVEIALSPGTYTMVLACDGFDPREIAPIPIASDAPTDLGTLPLSRGSAIVEGKVFAPSAGDAETAPRALRRGAQSLRRLPGDGEHCAGLRLRRRPLTAAVESGGTFAFAGLAAGDYQLWVRDAQDRTVIMRQLQLAPASVAGRVDRAHGRRAGDGQGRRRPTDGGGVV